MHILLKVNRTPTTCGFVEQKNYETAQLKLHIKLIYPAAICYVFNVTSISYYCVNVGK